MIKKDTKTPKGQNTDGKGDSDANKKESLVDKIKALLSGSDDDADLEGSDTSADELEGAGEDENEAEDEVDEKVTPADDADEEEEEEADSEEDDADPIPGDDGAKKFSQTEVNSFVQAAKKKQRDSILKQHKAEKATLTKQVQTLQGQLEGYLNGDRDAVKAELEALPEAIRKTAPASLKNAKGIAAVKRWLPGAKELAASLSPAKGNKGGFKPLTPTGGNGDDEEEVVKKAKTHSIYHSF